ncbi:MAG: mannonate dehydratase [Oscillospiraceae bacterium]|jgi:mannonate dehydratase|nr:mannonate dehydratase [Oscillospiraceae bacterium]
MQMTLRWFGNGLDTVTLDQIRQIPGVVGVVPALHDLPAGEVWPLERLQALRDTVHAAGLTMECIESVNVSDDIKLGNATGQKHIQNYIESIRNCAAVGVKVICYNFMPVFDWTRTDMAMPLSDGSTCLCYDAKHVEGKSPEDIFRELSESGDFAMPGWEPFRIPTIKALFAAYKGVTADDLRANLKAFLDAITPVCEECGVKMAIHPDDPPWPIFGLPRILSTADDLRWLFSAVPSEMNGSTFCTGSFGAGSFNDLPAMIREFGPRIYFAHLRNVEQRPGWFNETAHLSSAGSLDMYAIVKALHDCAPHWVFVRPDHGRMLWGETARPGYGLYDRALGAAYLNGLFEAVEKGS